METKCPRGPLEPVVGRLSDDLQRDHDSGDFGRALEGYPERALELERENERLRRLLAFASGAADQKNDEIERLQADAARMRADWIDAYAAFLGAFDTPAGGEGEATNMRRTHGSASAISTMR